MRYAIAVSLVLAGCAGQQLQPPPQPTPASVNAAILSLDQIIAPPSQVWEAGDYAVRTACDAYLDQAAARSAQLSLASTGVGMGGAAATGILAASGAFPGAALAGGLATLAQSFIAAYQASGALPYTTETSTMIDNAMTAYEAAVPPPVDTAQAMLDVEGLWALCSPVGYSRLVSKAVATASVSAAMPTQRLGLLPARQGRPVITVNGR